MRWCSRACCFAVEMAKAKGVRLPPKLGVEARLLDLVRKRADRLMGSVVVLQPELLILFYSPT